MGEKTLLIKKHLIRPFLHDAEADGGRGRWIQVKKATEFTRSMNPQTEERDYIADEHPTTEIIDYKPSEGLSVTMYKGEPDFDFVYNLYKKRAIGTDAQCEFLLVYVFDSVESGGKTFYYADKTGCTVAVDELNASGQTLSCTVYENGTPTVGYVEIEDGAPVFHAGAMPQPDVGAGSGE